jgi:hypothetical protein
VKITTAANNNVLAYTSATDIWENKTVATALGYTPVPTTRTLTINGTTQDLSADRTFTIATGLTVGTTPITSGTVGRVLFEGTGNVLQESANLFWDNTNSRLGIGTATPLAAIQNTGTTILSGAVAINSTNLSTGYALFVNGVIGVTSITLSQNLTIGENYAISNNGNQTIDIDANNNQTNAVFRVTNNGTANEIFRANEAGNFMIGTTTDAGFKLDVNGTARFSNAMTGFTLSLVGGTISATTHLTINGTNSAPSGTSMGISNNFTFFPNSGNANATAFSYEGTINQTGTATGITRGLYINPTITAAADFRAIEVARGITILGAATTAKASLRIPSGTAPTSPVNGDIWFDGTDIKMRIGGVTKTFTLI